MTPNAQPNDCEHTIETSDGIARAAQWLQDADGLLITAGAGMGVDSGLPDFAAPKASGARIRGASIEHRAFASKKLHLPKRFAANPPWRGHSMGIDSTCIAEQSHTVASTSCGKGLRRRAEARSFSRATLTGNFKKPGRGWEDRRMPRVHPLAAMYRRVFATDVGRGRPRAHHR